MKIVETETGHDFVLGNDSVAYLSDDPKHDTPFCIWRTSISAAMLTPAAASVAAFALLSGLRASTPDAATDAAVETVLRWLERTTEGK